MDIANSAVRYHSACVFRVGSKVGPSILFLYWLIRLLNRIMGYCDFARISRLHPIPCFRTSPPLYPDELTLLCGSLVGHFPRVLACGPCSPFKSFEPSRLGFTPAYGRFSAEVVRPRPYLSRSLPYPPRANKHSSIAPAEFFSFLLRVREFRRFPELGQVYPRTSTSNPYLDLYL